MTTTESSTIMPSTTMRAAKVTVFNSMPNRYMMAHAAAMQTGTEVEETKAVRKGKRKSITRMTMMMASMRSFRKECTDLLTTTGWSVMRCTLMSGGAVARKVSISLLTSSPKATTLFPGRISIEKMRHWLPLTKLSEYWMYCDASW